MNIKKFRITQKMTQEEMAMLIGCSINAYIQKEKGRVDFTVNEIKIIKAYFNLSVKETWNIFFSNKINGNET